MSNKVNIKKGGSRDKGQATRAEAHRLRSALLGLLDAVELQRSGDSLGGQALDQALDEARIASGGPEGWTPWETSTLTDEQNALLASVHGAAPASAFHNNIYEVLTFIEPMAGMGEDAPPVAHMSIKRHDKLPIDYDHWRVLQNIKNQLLGPNVDAIELYPHQNRTMDMSNQYHLYCLVPDSLWPVGEMGRAISSESLLDTAKQRPYRKGQRMHDDLHENHELREELLSGVDQLRGQADHPSKLIIPPPG